MKVFHFKNKTEKKVKNVVYNKDDIEVVERNENLLKKTLQKKSKDDFRSWFNEMFEKSNQENNTVGYGDWLKSSEDLNETTASNMNEFDRIFREKKKASRELVLRKA